MAIHNWIRCHWRNGRHELHDVPDTWHREIGAHLAKHRGRTRDLGMVRTASLDSVELAWVECDVPLGSPEGDLTYRRARAVHALVRARGEHPAWTSQEAASLLEERYGESVDKGLAMQHRVLTRLSHPEDVDQAAGLFVGVDARLPSELDRDDAFRAAVGTTGYARRYLVDAWEEWVAEARRRKPPHAPLSPAAVGRAFDALAAPLGECSPSESPLPPLAPLAAGERHAAPLPEASPCASPLVGDDPVAPAEAHAAPLGAELRPLDRDTDEPEREQQSQLFDLSRITRDGSNAPSSSLSGLLGPSHTTPYGA